MSERSVSATAADVLRRTQLTPSVQSQLLKNKETLLVLKYCVCCQRQQQRGLVTGLSDSFILARKRHPHLLCFLFEGIFILVLSVSNG